MTYPADGIQISEFKSLEIIDFKPLILHMSKWLPNCKGTWPHLHNSLVTVQRSELLPTGS